MRNFNGINNKTEFYKPTETMDRQSDIRFAMAAEIWQHELTNKFD